MYNFTSHVPFVLSLLIYNSQVSNSPVPEPPPPPGSMQQMQPNVVPPALRSISFSDTNYQRLYCNCSCNVANSNYATLTRQDTNSHYHSSIHQNGSYATGYSGGWIGEFYSCNSIKLELIAFIEMNRERCSIFVYIWGHLAIVVGVDTVDYLRRIIQIVFRLNGAVLATGWNCSMVT